MIQKTYDSRAESDFLELTAPYYNAIEPTTVFFPAEGVSVFVNSLGHVEFFDADGTSLGFVDSPAAESPDMYAHSGQYGTVRCTSDGRSVRIHLPVYRWEDSYPYCDGESDRWDRYTVRWFQVVFNCRSREITVQDR